MNDDHWQPHPPSGPLGLGRQGYLLIAIVIGGCTFFSLTRGDWTTAIISAIVLPLVMFSIIAVLSRLGQPGKRDQREVAEPGGGIDLLTVLARTNPLMFLLVGMLYRNSNGENYQDLLRTGPFGLGQGGYLIALVILLAPLLLFVLVTALTGGVPSHRGLGLL